MVVIVYKLEFTFSVLCRIIFRELQTTSITYCLLLLSYNLHLVYFFMTTTTQWAHTPVLNLFSYLPQSTEVSRLVSVVGLVVAASGVKAKAQTLTVQCRSCQASLNNLPVKPGLEGYLLPRKCNT